MFMPEALVLVLFEHGAKFLDLAGAFVEAGAQPIPDHLFLFGPWTFDDDLASWQRIQHSLLGYCVKSSRLPIETRGRRPSRVLRPALGGRSLTDS